MNKPAYIKPVLLVVGDYSRRNFLDLFEKSKDDFSFFFIEYASEKEIRDDYHKKYGKALFWKDFANAYELLEKIKPCKVVFFFIETYNHIALNVACKQRHIPTFHLEHGVRDFERNALMEKSGREPIRYRRMNRIVKAIPMAFTKFKTRAFFRNTLKKTKGEAVTFLSEYFRIRSKNSIHRTFELVNSFYRVADIYISFSPAIFKAHQLADHLPIDKPVHFIGIPFFDQWHVPAIQSQTIKAVLFIDQAFVKQKLLGWTLAFQQQFIRSLADACSSSGYSLLVKLHPVEDHSAWRKAEQHGLLSIIDNKQLEEMALKAQVVIGFYSTLLMPLAAMPHTTVFSLENHPVQGIFPSKFLVENGVSKAVENMDELKSCLGNIEAWHKEQIKNKQHFIDDWLYKLDGFAGNRLRDILNKGSER